MHMFPNVADGYSNQARLMIAAVLLLSAYAGINDYLLLEIHKYIVADLYLHAIKRSTMFVVGAVALGFLFVGASRPVLAIACAVVFVNATVNFAFRSIARDVLDADKSQWLFSEMGQVSNAVSEFALPVTLSGSRSVAVVLALLIARGLARPPMLDRVAPRWVKRLALLSIIPFACVTFVLYFVEPHPIPWEHNVTVGLMQNLARSVPEPAEVSISPIGSGISNIVVVIDESVRADTFRKYFGPSLLAAGAVEIRDTWTAVPCSGGANAFLRWGINPEKNYTMNDDPRRHPTIFGFAARAGYDRFLFDAQSTGSVQNFMSIGERALLTKLIPAANGIESDRLVARKINQLLRQDGKHLIYLVKKGSHFPYEKNFPPELKGNVVGKVAAYEQAVQFSNREFFELLLADVDRNSLLLVYTSDHGQNFGDNILPHCNPEPKRDELLVPLWVFAPAALASRLEKISKPVPGSHFSTLQILPTLLVAMGYMESEISPSYYRPLWAGATRRWLLRSPFLPYPAGKAGAVHFLEFLDPS